MPANPAWEWRGKRCQLCSQAGIAPPSSPHPHFSFQEPGVTVTNITAPTSGPWGHSFPCKRKQRLVVKHEPCQVLALKTPADCCDLSLAQVLLAAWER